MSDVRSILERGVGGAETPPGGYERMLRRRDRKSRNRRIRAGVLGIVIALGVVYAASSVIHSGSAPMTSPSPTPSTSGLLARVPGWIAYANETGRSGILAINPEAPGDPNAQVLLNPGPGSPVAWSSDGSKLLIVRPDTEQRPSGVSLRFGSDLFVLNVDGTETRLTDVGDVEITGGSFSPDGSRVVYATYIGDEPARIYVVDASGGPPQTILTAARRWIPVLGRVVRTGLYLPAFSPDGSKIAYFDGMGDHSHSLRVMDADGSSSRILFDYRQFPGSHIGHLVWSPDGTRLLFDAGGEIYAIRSDGSGLTRLLVGEDPHWSPDGSRIAYTHGGLVIADADGNNAQEFGYARAGPWNPVG